MKVVWQMIAFRKYENVVSHGLFWRCPRNLTITCSREASWRSPENVAPFPFRQNSTKYMRMNNSCIFNCTRPARNGQQWPTNNWRYPKSAIWVLSNFTALYVFLNQCVIFWKQKSQISLMELFINFLSTSKLLLVCFHRFSKLFVQLNFNFSPTLLIHGTFFVLV